MSAPTYKDDRFPKPQMTTGAGVKKPTFLSAAPTTNDAPPKLPGVFKSSK